MCRTPAPSSDDYVHGYSDREAQRLHDQAGSARDLFHRDTRFPAGSLVLEVGCGVGANTVTLATNSADTRFTSIDTNRSSLDRAAAFVARRGLSNVSLCQADLFETPFAANQFDHIWVSHVLEHLTEPLKALTRLRGGLKEGGTITVIEGDHGSCYFYPEGPAALRVWHCLVRAQAQLGANSLIGRQLFPLLSDAGYHNIHVSPRMVYADRSTPALVESFVERTIIPMVEGVRDRVLEAEMIDESTWDEGIDQLHEIARREDGTFCYTFFKGTAAV